MPEYPEGEWETELPVFDAQRPNFQPFRVELEDYIQSTLKVSYIPRAVQATVEVLLAAYQNAARTNSPFSLNFADHENELKTAMSNKGVESRIHSGSTRWLSDHMGVNYAEYKKLGVTQAEHKIQLADEKCEWILHLHRKIHKKLAQAIWAGDYQAPGTTYTDSLRPILLSQPLLDLVLDSKGDRTDWIEKPYKQPIVEALALLYFKYQGAQDPQSLNFAT